ncbi:uncharacterized protein LACBIDRAFT_332892 [Laccaria bicolor S238N-H82]|uniref:Predicted protein n=1 Tax=Laccaria bicolor (strain S238N-H82 / ATCC MYA-4686) TaxID=486041 RepID=B0DU65_LACBS|nr:uncharacterized protein LACBIDRAFT_332892 [Laccaria bicolor S238N-H82]EDR01851.1 predicted protein [Laccaria bicolor S238N-H82]|eukprot:XP_001887461.1 predicted protein [Laccaria bicolor S238N-H82]
MLLSMLMFSVLVLPSVLLQRAIEGGGLRFGLGVTVGVYKCDVWDVWPEPGFAGGKNVTQKERKRETYRSQTVPEPLDKNLTPQEGWEQKWEKSRGQRRKEEACSKGQKEHARRDPSEERLRIKDLENGRKGTHLAHPGKARTFPLPPILPPLIGYFGFFIASRLSSVVLQPAVAAIDDISFGDAYPLLLILIDVHAPTTPRRVFLPPHARRSAALELPRYNRGHHQPPSPIDAPSTPLLFFGPRITNRQDINDVSGCYGRPAYKRVITPLSPAPRGVDVLPMHSLSLPPLNNSSTALAFPSGTYLLDGRTVAGEAHGLGTYDNSHEITPFLWTSLHQEMMERRNSYQLFVLDDLSTVLPYSTSIFSSIITTVGPVKHVTGFGLSNCLRTRTFPRQHTPAPTPSSFSTTAIAFRFSYRHVSPRADRRNLFDERGRRLDHPSDKGAGASYPRPRVRRGVWRRGVAGMSGNDDEDADESGDSEQEDSSGEESDTESEESGDSEDDEDEDDTEGVFSSTPFVHRASNRL